MGGGKKGRRVSLALSSEQSYFKHTHTPPPPPPTSSLASLRRDSHATASVPLGNKLQNLTDGNGLTWMEDTQKES